MFFYISFLRPPPTSCSNAVSITPQIANDLRTELMDGVQDIYYSWLSVATGQETKPMKLTTWRGQSSAYKEINRKSRPSVLAEVFGDVVGNTFCANEDKNFCVLGAYLVEVLGKLATLLKVTANFHNLCDVVVGGEFHRANVDLNHVFEEVLDEMAPISKIPRRSDPFLSR